MKHIIFFTGVALLCGASFAQQEPPSGKPAARAQAKVEAKTGQPATAVTAGAAAGTSSMGMGMGMDMKAMDTNGDGMISKKEWQDYHGKMWGRMKANKAGMVPITDIQATMKGGPN